jgi:hypothetical protein
MTITPPQPPTESDEELAQTAAELATSWISPTTRLPETKGWQLVALQHPGSGHMEMHAWDEVLSWERELTESLQTAGTPAEQARAEAMAIATMRTLILEGLRTATAHDPAAPRTRLRDFITTHDKGTP